MKQIFAVSSVLVGLASQVLLVAFLLDLTPVGINRGEPPMAWLAIVNNVALLALFALPHSLMARPAFKRRWRLLVPDAIERSAYIFVSGALLALLCLAWQPMPGLLWQVDNELARVGLRALFAGGLLVLAWSIFSIDALHFHGLKQAFGRQEDPPFAMRGPYRYVRHPIQSGLIVALWATPELTAGHMLFASVLTIYSVIASLMLEERDLRSAIGDAYQDYRRRVPAFIPSLRWRG